MVSGKGSLHINFGAVYENTRTIIHPTRLIKITILALTEKTASIIHAEPSTYNG